MTMGMPEWALEIPSAPVHQSRPNELTRPFTPQQLLQIGGELIEQFLKRVVLALAGVFVPGNLGAAFDQLKDWADNLGAQITSFIYSVSGLDFSSWPNFVASLSDGHGIDLPGIGQALEGIDLSSPGSVLAAIVGALRRTLTSWLPQVDLGSIGRFSPNLLEESNFSEEITIDDDGGFFWDGSTGRTSLGCAAVVCDGETHVLVSDHIPVSEGQKLDVGGFVSYAGVTSGSNSVCIDLNTYLNGVAVSTEPIDTLTPSGTDDDWSLELSGEYVVPAGVDTVATQLRVTSAATAGTIRFDDCWLKKLQKLLMEFTEKLKERWEQTAALFGITDTDLDGDVDIADVWNALWAAVLKPLGWIPTVAQNIIDRIVGAFENLGQLGDLDNPVSRVLDAIFGIFSTGLTANTRVAAFEARVRALESAANTIVLDFNGPSASNPGAGFSVSSSGGGAGQMGLNGSGALVWQASGAGNRTQIARYTTSALTTNNCVLEWILASSPQSYIFDDGFTYICARMNGTTDYLRIRSGYDTVRVQAVVSGVVSNVGAAWTGGPKAGDAFAWQIGDTGGANNRHHVLTRNGVTLLDFTESTSLYGASYLHVGCGMETGNRLVFTQNIPAGLSVLTAAEVL